MTHRTFIDMWPTLADFAADIGVAENTAKQMRTRANVNGQYWLALVNGASRRGIAGVTFESLAATAKPRKREKANAA